MPHQSTKSSLVGGSDSQTLARKDQARGLFVAATAQNEDAKVHDETTN